MFLSKLELNPRIDEVRRDLVSPYEMHSTLHRAFPTADKNSFLWREERASSSPRPVVLVQSLAQPDWRAISVPDYFAQVLTKPYVLLSLLAAGERLRFRLRANPVVTTKLSDDKTDKRRRRTAIQDESELRAWLRRQGAMRAGPQGAVGGFEPEIVEVTGRDKIRTKQRKAARDIVLFAVTFEGVLRVTDVGAFGNSIRMGLGKGKAFGLGMLSVAPLR